MEEFKVPTLPPPAATSKPEKKPQEILKDSSSPAFKETQETSKPSTNESPYKVPSWSSIPTDQEVKYRFEVLKSGQIIEEIEDLQKQAIWNFGRLPENDVVMAHPTISRFHAVLQYRPAKEDPTTDEEVQKGWFIYDLESTHGTFLNKQRIPPRVYIRMRVGHMLRLGASTRSYILQGPIEDEEPESEKSVTELREERIRQQEDAIEMKRKAAEEAEERQRNEGINWGMGDDADEETDLTHNPYASTNNEEIFLDDPKKTLRGYFEREDLPLEYKCDEMSVGCFVCRVELPIDDTNGRPIVAEVVHKGRKKECVVQCALEACRILDRHGVLRQANQEPLKRKTKSKDSDSDDDEFWDRTGDVARRKQRKANSNTNVTLTYDDLVKQETELRAQLTQVEADITEYQLKEKKEKERKQVQDNADLDSFMEQLDEDVSKLDKTEIKKLRLQQQRLKAEHLKLQRLIKISKPYEIPSVFENSSTTYEKTNSCKKQLPMIGKRNQFSKFKVAKLPSKVSKASKNYASDEEEIEDDNEDQLDDKRKTPSTHEGINADNITVNNQTPNEDNKTETSKIKDPELLPNELQSTNIVGMKICESAENEALKKAQTDDADSTMRSFGIEEGDNNAKRRHRQRPRQRNKRHEVDIDELDEHESSEKYAKWVPPPNQTGDGFTPLNEKYGY